MKEIHIRSGVERLNLIAFTMLPVIELGESREQ